MERVENLKFNIDFWYTEKYLPTQRHRKLRERKVKSSVDVDILEMTGEEFPIAFIVHDMKSVQDGMKSYSDYTSEKCHFRMFAEEIRTYNGELYMPVRITHGTAISTVFEDERYVVGNLERIARENWYDRNESFFSKNSIIIWDNKKEICKMIYESAKKYIYYDGKFWSACGEPRYVINTFGLGHNHGGTGFFIEYGYNTNIPAKRYFNALQRDDAIAYGKSVALSRGDTESVDGIGAYDNIEVVMPEMVKVNPSKQHGDGDPFVNSIEDIISGSCSAMEAGLLCIAKTAAEISM